MTIRTFRVTATYTDAKKSVRGHFTVEARTVGDAIVQAQSKLAQDQGLSHSDSALVRVEFEEDFV